MFTFEFDGNHRVEIIEFAGGKTVVKITASRQPELHHAYVSGGGAAVSSSVDSGSNGKPPQAVNCGVDYPIETGHGGAGKPAKPPQASCGCEKPHLDNSGNVKIDSDGVWIRANRVSGLAFTSIETNKDGQFPPIQLDK